MLAVFADFERDILCEGSKLESLKLQGRPATRMSAADLQHPYGCLTLPQPAANFSGQDTVRMNIRVSIPMIDRPKKTGKVLRWNPMLGDRLGAIGFFSHFIKLVVHLENGNPS